MTDTKLTCPNCGSDQVTLTHEQMFMANTMEHWCHSVKVQDQDAKAYCIDCDWEGERHHLNEVPA